MEKVQIHLCVAAHCLHQGNKSVMLTQEKPTKVILGMF